jgi:hypothetical protein
MGDHPWALPVSLRLRLKLSSVVLRNLFLHTVGLARVLEFLLFSPVCLPYHFGFRLVFGVFQGLKSLPGVSLRRNFTVCPVLKESNLAALEQLVSVLQSA